VRERGQANLGSRTIGILDIKVDGDGVGGRFVELLMKEDHAHRQRGVTLEVGGEVVRESDVGEVVPVLLEELQARNIRRRCDVVELLELIIRQDKDRHEASDI